MDWKSIFEKQNTYACVSIACAGARKHVNNFKIVQDTFHTWLNGKFIKGKELLERYAASYLIIILTKKQKRIRVKIVVEIIPGREMWPIIKEIRCKIQRTKLPYMWRRQKYRLPEGTE